AVIIAAVAFVVILSCVAGIIVLLIGDSTEIGKIPSTTESQTEGQYEDIGSTDATQNSSGGSVLVTDVSKVVENTMQSVVAITCKTVMESNDYGSIYDFYFGGREGGQQYEVEGAGSGIIVHQTDTELLIVTNNHVVEGANSLKIQFDGMEADEAVDGYIK